MKRTAQPDAVRPLTFKPSWGPKGMAAMDVEHDQAKLLQKIAIEIFTDMTNAGKTFQEALAAIYLSGLVHAVRLPSFMSAALPTDTQEAKLQRSSDD